MSTYDVTVDMTLDVDVTMADGGYDIQADIGEFTIIDTHPQYQGSYDVTPRVYSQTLDTDGKVMTSDVTVYEIPITRTSNVEGGLTVLIG